MIIPADDHSCLYIHFSETAAEQNQNAQPWQRLNISLITSYCRRHGCVSRVKTIIIFRVELFSRIARKLMEKAI